MAYQWIIFLSRKRGEEDKHTGSSKTGSEERKYITLPEFEGGAKIKPTNGRGNCIVMNADGSNPSKYGWQPSADELIRDDWLLVD